MPPIHRRHFLQFAGATLASLGLSQLDFLSHTDRTARVLAQPTRRKLALLIGINQYANSIASLNGCLTDVEMQYELLRHRYGFQPADILLLTDETPEKPTRDNILAAFETHLIQQAKPGDVVVFHYSGHGGLVTDPQPLDATQLNGTLIPSDCTLTQRNDIMGRTLFLLSSQIQTEHFTTRSANDSEDSVVQTTRNLVSDITRAGAKPPSGGGAVTRGLDPTQSGVFSAILQVID